jgi:hypothetical protein
MKKKERSKGEKPLDKDTEQLLCTLCKEHRKRTGKELPGPLRSSFRKRIRKSLKKLAPQGALAQASDTTLHGATDEQIIEEWKTRHPENGYDVALG